MTEICDIHGHFLPAMDDGCKTVEESLLVLRESYAQGIRCMVATPHYYPVETVEAFLARRQNAWQSLKAYLDNSLPRVVLGAEVAYHPGLCYEKNLDRLCMGNSRYLLLEMPFSQWENSLLRDVRSICTVMGITPIIAHLERYLGMQKKSAVHELLDMNVLVQMNAENLLGRFDGRAGRKMIKSGMVQLLGSDCHNMTHRRPNLGKAMEILKKHGMQDYLDTLTENSFELMKSV